MTKEEMRERAEMLRDELERLQNIPQAREAWILDNMAWRTRNRKQAENALQKRLAFLQATINLYSK